MLKNQLVRSWGPCVMSGKFTSKARHFRVRRFLLFTALFIYHHSYSQKYPVSAIPDSLKENANVIVRLAEENYEIKSPVEAYIKLHYIYTILNEKGEDEADYVSQYNNKTRFINNLSGTLYDQNGKELRHFKKKDMVDRAAYDGVSFVNDERIKIGGFSYRSYPYTVEFEEELEVRELINIHRWLPQSDNRHSIERSVCSITAPAEYQIRFKMLHSDIKPTVEDKGKTKTYSWELRNISAFEKDAYSGNLLNYVPWLMIGLSDIQMGDYKGNMNTWNDFAKFYGSLQRGRDVLPDDVKQKVHELTNGISDPQQKISILYHYLQQNTHYVAILLGIGGWQTYDANYVASKKYGDCKALSNFMVALSKECGIKAYPVVILGGPERSEFVKDFVYDPFNHVICCVPLGNDTVWLECTSQTLPTGYLSKFTANRYGLFIDQDGGSLVHTPAYLLKENTQYSTITAVLDPEGNLRLKSKTSYKALCQDDLSGQIHNSSKQEQLNYLKSSLGLPTYDVTAFSYNEDMADRLPVIQETVDINVNGYAQITGKRIFINPNILNRMSGKLPEEKNRNQPVVIGTEVHYKDSVEITIPAGYSLESKNADLELKTPFGKFTSRTVLKNDKIIYYRDREQISGRFPAKDYAELVKYYNQIVDADHTNLVLVRKTN